MTRAAMPANEVARLAALREAEILDTGAERAFEDLVRTAAALCRTAFAAVSLVDRDRQWFKAIVGLNVTEAPRHGGFCTHAILGDQTFIVADARQDPRFFESPLVTTDPLLRFYAGAPIVTADGYALGTVCVGDYQPRTLSASQSEALRALASTAAAYLDLRRTVRALAKRNRLLVDAQEAEAEARESVDELLDSTHDLIQVTDLEDHFLFTNRAWKEALGYSEPALHERSAPRGAEVTVEAAASGTGRVRFAFRSECADLSPEELRSTFALPEQRPAGSTPPLGLTLPVAGLIVKANEGTIGAAGGERESTLWFELPSP